jgi:hypothetical protein
MFAKKVGGRNYSDVGLIAIGEDGLRSDLMRSDFPLILQHIHSRSKILDERIMVIDQGIYF